MNNPRSSLQIALLGNFAIFMMQGHQQLDFVLHAFLPCITRVLPTKFVIFCCLLLQVPAHRSFATSVYSRSIQYANRVRSSSCAMGKSRSATVVIAYLMQKHNIGPSDALAHVRQARSIVEPNEGFWKQLELYSEMQKPENVEETPAYQRWVYQRELELSRACAQAPEADKIRFEDEHATEQTSGFEMRCRKCRLVVFLRLSERIWNYIRIISLPKS
jgi:hypothetical protein